jgi:hypothetical protein
LEFIASIDRTQAIAGSETARVVLDRLPGHETQKQSRVSSKLGFE